MSTTIEEIQKKMVQLLKVDREVCQHFLSLKDLVRTLNGRIPARALMLAGSGFEEATLPRWWFHVDGPQVFGENGCSSDEGGPGPYDNAYDSDTNSGLSTSSGVGSRTAECNLKFRNATKSLEDIVTRELEVDLMYIAATITEEYKNILEPIPDKPGHVAVRIDPTFLECVEPGIVKNVSDGVTNGYLDSYKLKQLLLQKAPFSDDAGVINLLLGAVLGVKPRDVRFTVKEELSKASYKCDVWFRIGDKDVFKYASDHVPSIRLAFWPDIAAGWLDGDSRGRKWPPPDDIKYIRDQGCNIVARPSSQGDVHRELRYSFSQPEMTLASMRSSQQKLVYFLFKTLFYMWIKPLDSDHLASYYGKTIMLWASERYPPDHAIWAEDALTSALHYLLSELTQHLRKGHLPHFFIPEINVIAEIPKHTRGLAVSKLVAVRENLVGHIPGNLEEMTAMACKICKQLKEADDIIKAVAKFKDTGDIQHILPTVMSLLASGDSDIMLLIPKILAKFSTL